MPYIGNNHIAGDHTNNFKVLDDISSFTATFDGSATSVVDTTNNTIRVVEHRFIQGQRVTYTNGGGGNIGGLTTGTAYFVIFDSASTIKLATSASNAANSTAINLSAVGSGTSHTLNAAFDGVNTKFKLTHGSGTGARLNNATQINVAINNVLQRPNLDPNNFTDGFALEDNHKIVFQTAPTSEDIFWGSIIANTLTTFDISDHKIDTFTGDGSTTEFTLSHTPANNESLMVTINGVLQHPSNASTARAYTLIASIIQFTAAPGVGDEIQVRHLGFAGATTADVSGFYGRTGNVVLGSTDHITTGDITSRNINAGIVTATSFNGSFSPNVGGSNANFTGIVTAGTFKGGNIDAVDGAFSGNVTIGGTLTYEDVTNIDSVGIITARDGIDCNGDIDVDGHTNLDNVNIAGVTTFTGISDHSSRLQMLAGNPIRLLNDANSAHCEIDCYGGAGFKLTSYNQTMFTCENGQSTIFYTNSGQNRLQITNAGNVLIAKDLDVDGHTNLDNVSVAGVSTFTGNSDFSAGIDVTGNAGVSGNISVGGVISIPDTIQHVNDTNTKIRFPAVDTVSVETAGSERLRIDSTGHTTIYSGVHDKGLDILATANSRETRFRIQGKASDGTEHNFTFGAKASANRLDMYGTGPMCFIGTQNVGVQNAAPTSPLHVGGDTNPHTTKALLFVGPASGDGTFHLRGGSPTVFFDSTSGGDPKILTDGRDLKILNGTIDSNGTEILHITSGGNIGIKESNPTDDLEVKGDQTATIFINAGTHDASTANEATLKLGYNQSHTNDSIGYVKLIEAGGNSFDGYLTFGVPYNNSGTPLTREALRIDYSGRVMIGTTSAPNNSNTDDFTLATSGATGFTIRSGTLHDGQIAFSDGTSGADEYRGQVLYNHGSDYMRFVTNATEKLRITSDGQIGVNNTSPDAWYSTYRSIQIYDGAVLYGSADDSFVGLGANHFLNTSGDFKYSNTDFASRFYQVNGGFHFESAASGTAGNTFSFTERLRIDSSGNVGIDQTNPSAYGKFVVNGTGNVISLRASSGAGSLAFFEAGTGRFFLKTLNGDDGLSFVDGDNSTERLRIESGGTLFSKSPSDATPNFKFISDDTNWHGYLNQTVHGATISTILSCGGTWTVDGTTYNATKDYNGSFGTAALIVHNQYNSTATGGELVFMTKANGSSTTDGAVTTRLRINSSGFVGINENNPNTGLTIAALGDYSANDGNTYYMPRGKWASAWNGANAIQNSTDYWVGFVGGYHKSSSSVNISLAPNRGNVSAQQGMYISGEATGNSTSDIGMGYILGGSSTGQGTSGNYRATKRELLRLKSDGRLGINVNPSTANEYLTVKPNGNNVLDIAYRLNSSTDIRHKHYSDDGTYRGGFNYTRYANNTRYPNLHHDHYWITNPSGTSTQVSMRLTREGYLLQQYIPAFGAAKSDHSGQIGSGVYVFNQVHWNQGNHYSSSNGRFTAPKAGAYFFSFSLQLYGANAVHARFQINGSDVFSGGTSSPVYEDGPDSHETISHSMVLNLAEGDYVTVTRNANTRGMQSSFCGYLLG